MNTQTKNFSLLVLSYLKRSFKTITWSQNNFSPQLNLVDRFVLSTKFKFSDKSGNDGFHGHHGVLLTDAVHRSCRERYVGKRMSVGTSLWWKPIRVEFERVRPVFGTSMNVEYPQHNNRALWKRYVLWKSNLFSTEKVKHPVPPSRGKSSCTSLAIKIFGGNNLMVSLITNSVYLREGKSWKSGIFSGPKTRSTSS